MLQRIRSRKPASDAFTVNGVCWTRRSVLTPGQWRLAIKLFILALVQVSRSGARREPGNPREHVNTAFSLPITRQAAHSEAEGRPAWLVSGLEPHSPWPRLPSNPGRCSRSEHSLWGIRDTQNAAWWPLVGPSWKQGPDIKDRGFRPHLCPVWPLQTLASLRDLGLSSGGGAGSLHKPLWAW